MENRNISPVAPERSVVNGEQMLEYYIVSAANVLKNDLLFTEAEPSFRSSRKRRSKNCCTECEEHNQGLCNNDIVMKFFEVALCKNTLDYLGKANLKTVTRLLIILKISFTSQYVIATIFYSTRKMPSVYYRLFNRNIHHRK